MGKPRNQQDHVAEHVGTEIDSIASAELQTSCSHCGTVFEVSVDVLTAPDSRVRCGECYGIFDALTNLVDPENAPEELAGLVDRHQPMPAPGATAEAAPAPGDITSGGQVAPIDDIELPDLDGEDGVRQRGHASELSGSVRVVGEVDSGSSQASSLPSATAASLAGLANANSALDQTFSEHDLFSGEAELPEIALFDATRDATRDADSIDFDEMAAGEDETFNETLMVHDLTVGEPDFMAATGIESNQEVSTRHSNEPDDGDPDRLDIGNTTADIGTAVVGTATASSTIDFRYRDRDDEDSAEARLERRRRRERGTAFEGDAGFPDVIAEDAGDRVTAGALADDPLVQDDAFPAADEVLLGDMDKLRPEKGKRKWLQRMILALLALVLSGSLWLMRDPVVVTTTAAQNPILRPVYGGVCILVGCELPPRVDFSQIRVLGRHVYSHPEIEEALVIEVVLRNDAGFEQRYPNLAVRLSNVRGQRVAEREFTPEEYLDDWQEGDLFGVGKRLDISLEVADPGSDAASFELDFL
ncbi:MAG: hypothetical protein CSB44_11235 [Gammaproteobacteria bacterium]|nr:MAG: hypothetical protein CSB44_11235 [Gammaproteobacteria bacterium]